MDFRAEANSCFMQRRFRADIGHQDSLLCLPRGQPSSTIFRTGRLLTPSMPVSSSALPASRRSLPSFRFLTAARDRKHHRECWSLLKNCSNLARPAVEVPGNPPVPLSMEGAS